MCGIAGFWGAPDAALLATMTARIAHRGPDGEGFFEHPLASLGHRRLAIIDPAGGHQPVGTDDGRVQLTYNGEVYNFRELRAELEPLGHTFHTSCDTEVVLHAYLEWGTDCFARFNGMWALAILDLRRDDERARARLVLARDHYGIKPLYYARSGSGAGAVRVGGQGGAGRSRARDGARPAVALRLPAARPPRPPAADRVRRHPGPGRGHVGGGRRRRRARADVLDAGTVERRPGRSAPSSAPASSASVERRLVADVPAGTCLSGGIDSSSIVGMASGLLSAHVPDAVSLGDRLKTFSIVYDGDPIDEREYMDAVLAEVDAEPAFAEPTSERFVDELDRLVWHQDEPIVSTGPYAQWCVMRLAQPKVTVLLNGQGGDELLGRVRALPVRLPAGAAAPPALRSRSRGRRGSRATC